MTGLSPREIVTRGISHVPEGRRLFKTLSVRDNLLLGAFHRNDRMAVMRDLDFVFSVFPRLHERAQQDATTLSGGEQQMCAIGRGFMARPSLLIIDELSLGLAPSAIELLAESLGKIQGRGHFDPAGRAGRRSRRLRFPTTAMCWNPAASPPMAGRTSFCR